MTGSGGLGKEFVLAIAKKNPKQIYMTGRNESTCRSAIEEIKSQIPNVTANITFLQCDLASLSTVQEVAEKFRREAVRLDLLICCAGIMLVPPGLTKDGYEIQFGTNHLGHALLINLVLPILLRTAKEPNSDVRIVTFSSQGWGMHPMKGIVFDKLRTTQANLWIARYQLYGQSKLANILYAAEIARRFPQLTSVSIHPGVIFTNLVTSTTGIDQKITKLTASKMVLSPEEGTRNALWAATTKKESITNGAYYEPLGDMVKLRRKGNDKELAQKLWEWTDKELEKYAIQDDWN
jgi:NAD(P)-dependent dehydrogenase (short-subunit alcohol dehydrogenase family)